MKYRINELVITIAKEHFNPRQGWNMECGTTSGTGCGTSNEPGCGTTSGTGCGTSNEPGCGTTSGTGCGTSNEPGCGTTSGTGCGTSNEPGCGTTSGTGCGASNEPGCGTTSGTGCGTSNEPGCGTTSGTGCGTSDEPGCGTTTGTDCGSTDSDDIANWWTEAESIIKAAQLDRLLLDRNTRGEMLELLQMSKYQDISEHTNMTELEALEGKLRSALKEVRNHINVKNRNIRNR